MGKLRKLLLPFSLLYGGLMNVRNTLYDQEILKSFSFTTPVICVGNLSVGGTGKTPMTEYILRLLLPEFKIATLSRGYGRKTSGYIELNGNEKAEAVGDEPLQFKVKFPEVVIAVDENRQNGITNLLTNHCPDVVLLDDAFQHRKVKAGFNLLLTAYGCIYSKDLVLPAGNLREPRTGASRAHIVVVTKCPQNLSIKEQEQIRKKIKLENRQSLYFSFIKYSDEIIHKDTAISLKSLQGKKFTLVTGIAGPEPLVAFLNSKGLNFHHQCFPDHHNFTSKDLEEISGFPIVLTTEKDYMRLKHLDHPRLFYIPIEMDFLHGKEDFNKNILEFVHEK